MSYVLWYVCKWLSLDLKVLEPWISHKSNNKILNTFMHILQLLLKYSKNSFKSPFPWTLHPHQNGISHEVKTRGSKECKQNNRCVYTFCDKKRSVTQSENYNQITCHFIIIYHYILKVQKANNNHIKAKPGLFFNCMMMIDHRSISNLRWSILKIRPIPITTTMFVFQLSQNEETLYRTSNSCFLSISILHYESTCYKPSYSMCFLIKTFTYVFRL